jgi:hypothetical protein
VHRLAGQKNWEYIAAVHQLFIDLKIAHDSVRREVLYSILTEFSVPMKLVRLIKVSLNGTYSKVIIGSRLSVSVQNALKEGGISLTLILNALKIYC